VHSFIENLKNDNAIATFFHIVHAETDEREDPVKGPLSTDEALTLLRKLPFEDMLKDDYKGEGFGPIVNGLSYISDFVDMKQFDHTKNWYD
jgi:hypothetical protein